MLDIGRDAIKLGTFDVDAVIAGVASLTEDQWAADASRQQRFDAHNSTQAIRLIGDTDFRHQNPTVHREYRDFETALTPLMDHVRAYHSQTLRQRNLVDRHGPGYFVRAILTRLPSGTEIKKHIDEGFSLKRSHRIHVPLVSNDHALFTVGELSFHMPVGEMWEINNRRVHSVKNGGSDARIHLIMDYVQPGEIVFDAEGPLTA